MVKPALLITGAGGFLGDALCRAAAPAWNILGIYRRHKPRAAHGRWLQMDLTDRKALADSIAAIEPAAVIHAAAEARSSQCRQRPQETEAINVTVPAWLADICARRDMPLAFISTDLVFDGRRPPYDEACEPHPRTVYGDQKARAEKQVLGRHPTALVCRLPLLIGPAPRAAANFTLQMIAAIARNRPISLFVDEYRTPVDIWSASRGILQFVGHLSGVLHLGGRTRISRHGLGIMAAELMGIAPTMIRAVHVNASADAEPRSPDCSLISRRAWDHGYDPFSLNEALRRTIAKMRRP